MRILPNPEQFPYWVYITGQVLFAIVLPLAIFGLYIAFLLRLRFPFSRGKWTQLALFSVLVFSLRFIGHSFLRPYYAHSDFLDTLYDAIDVIGASFCGIAIYFHAQSWSGLRDKTKVSGPLELEKCVNDIIDSKQFLSALRTALPVGKRDKEEGVDYVPFMLLALSARQERAANSATIFLRLTVILGVVLSVVVGFLGFYVINEVSVGAPKVVAEARGDLKYIRENLPNLETRWYNNPFYQSSVEPLRNAVVMADPGATNGPIRDAIAAVELYGDSGLDRLYKTGSKYRKEVIRNAALGRREADFSRKFDQMLAALAELRQRQRDSLTGIEGHLKSVDELVAKSTATIQEKENRTAELLKRIAIGTIVATFLLPIIRFLGNLHRRFYEESLRAEDEELAIRKFYVAFKSSEFAPDQRLAILKSLVTSDGPKPDDKSKQDGDTLKESELLKELLSALAKKL